MTPTEHRDLLIKYIFAKIAIADWHGVSDAANDIWELEAAHPEIKKNAIQE